MSLTDRARDRRKASNRRIERERFAFYQLLGISHTRRQPRKDSKEVRKLRRLQ